MQLEASWIPWTVFAFGMFITFCVIYSKTESFRKALLGSLFVGKTFAVVYRISGLDKVVLTLYLVNRKAPWIARSIHSTACETIFVSFLATTVLVIAFPLIVKHMGREYNQLLPHALWGYLCRELLF